MARGRVAITGATGYLGSVLAEHFANSGNEVIALSRHRPTVAGMQWRQYDLAEPVRKTIFEGVDVLIHAAWGLSGKNSSELWRVNVVGSRRLIDAAVEAGVRKIVFVSSMSAYFGTRQTYGLMKLAVERTALDAGCVVVRPGLVFGEAPGGMAGTLQKITRLPLWPRFRSAKLFLGHQDDIASAMSTVVQNYDQYSGHVIGLANPDPLDLGAVFAGLSAQRKRRPSIYVPARLVMGILRALERAGVKFPFRSDSLLGLVEGPNVVPGRELLSRRGLKFRGLTEPTSKGPNRNEGSSILSGQL